LQISVKTHKPEAGIKGPHVFLDLLRHHTPPGVQWVEGSADILLLVFGAEHQARKRFKYRAICTRCDGLYYLGDKKSGPNLNRQAADRYRCADGIIFQSHFCQQQYHIFVGARPVPQRIIPNGTEMTHRAGRRPCGVVSCAGWRMSKRPHLVADLARRLKHSAPDVKITVIGPYKGKVYDNMVVLGTVKRRRLDGIYRQNNVFFHPAYQDPCPNTVVEAVAHGLYVVGSDTGGIPDIVGQNGRLIHEEPCFHQLEKPPRLNMDVVESTVLEALEKNESQSFRRDLMIQNVAAAYTNFWQSLLRGK